MPLLNLFDLIFILHRWQGFKHRRSTPSCSFTFIYGLFPHRYASFCCLLCLHQAESLHSSDNNLVRTFESIRNTPCESLSCSRHKFSINLHFIWWPVYGCLYSSSNILADLYFLSESRRNSSIHSSDKFYNNTFRSKCMISFCIPYNQKSFRCCCKQLMFLQRDDSAYRQNLFLSQILFTKVFCLKDQSRLSTKCTFKDWRLHLFLDMKSRLNEVSRLFLQTDIISKSIISFVVYKPFRVVILSYPLLIVCLQWYCLCNLLCCKLS